MITQKGRIWEKQKPIQFLSITNISSQSLCRASNDFAVLCGRTVSHSLQACQLLVAQIISCLEGAIHKTDGSCLQSQSIKVHGRALFCKEHPVFYANYRIWPRSNIQFDTVLKYDQIKEQETREKRALRGNSSVHNFLNLVH